MSSHGSSNGNRSVPAALCPECGRKGGPVAPITLEALLRPDALARLENSAYCFCAAPGCPVVYFSHGAASVYYREELKVRVGVKEAEDPIPICYCFGHTRAGAWEEIRRTAKSTLVASITAHVHAGRCACEMNNPSGRCCLGEVNRVVKEGLARYEVRLEEPTAVATDDCCAIASRGTRAPVT